MNANPRRAWLMALVGVGLLVGAGCTSAIAGQGTLAAADDPVDRPTDDPTDEPTDDPPDEPTDDPPTNNPGGGGVTRDPDAENSRMCQLFTDDQLSGLFEGPVTLSVPYGSYESCRFSIDASNYVELVVWDDEKPDFRMFNTDPTTFAGHPAYIDEITISVALGDDINAVGCLQGDNFFSFEQADQGREIDEALVETAIGEFAVG